MQTTETNRSNGIIWQKQQIETALGELRLLKRRVSDLRLRCEDFKKQQSLQQSLEFLCSTCGKPIEQGEEVTLKGSFGEVRSHHHKDCFRDIWLSQHWKFDYSYPGFLRPTEKRR